MTRLSGTCWKCGEPWEGDSQPGRRDLCPKCGFDLRCCMNCDFHDTRYRNECRIPESEPVKDRERSNFCEHFAFSTGEKGGKSQEKFEEARKKLDELFGG